VLYVPGFWSVSLGKKLTRLIRRSVTDPYSAALDWRHHYSRTTLVVTRLSVSVEEVSLRYTLVRWANKSIRHYKTGL
jgi:hypothetical protein